MLTTKQVESTQTWLEAGGKKAKEGLMALNFALSGCCFNWVTNE